VPLPVLLSDHETLGILAVNDAALCQYGWSRKAFQEMTIEDLRVPEPGEVTGAVTVTGRHRRHRRADGSAFDVEVTSHSETLLGHSCRLTVVVDVTNRLRAERALRESEARVRAILDGAVDAIVTVDGKGRIQDWNRAAQTMFGWAQSEAVGRRMTGLLFSEEAPPGVRGGSVSHGYGMAVPLIRTEIDAVRRDGSRLPVSVVGSEVHVREETWTCYLLSDISERRRVESHRAARLAVTRILSEQTSFTEAAPQILAVLCENLGWPVGAVWTPEAEHLRIRCSAVHGVATAAGDGFLRHIESAELEPGQSGPGMAWERRQPLWVDRLSAEQDVHAVEAAAAGFDSLLAFPVLCDGEVVAVCELLRPGAPCGASSLMPVLADMGAQLGMFWKRRRAEKAQRDLQVRYENLFQSIPDAVIVTNEARQIVEANAACKIVFGFHPSELQGKSTRMFYARESDYIRIGAAMVENPVVAEVCMLQREDGNRFPAEIMISRLVDGLGRERGRVSLVRDVSERERLSDQLRQAQKMEAIGRLAGGVAHDFNNLLTAIQGYAGLVLAQVEPTSRLHGMVQQIQLAGETAAGLTRQLLAFSRKQVLEPAIRDANDLIERTLGILRRVIGEDVEVRTDLDRSVGPVLADAGQFQQVLLNMAVNARDAMPTGGTFSIRTAPRFVAAGQVSDVTPGSYVRVEVSDTGTGMDSETLRHLFEPFFTTKEEGRGTGLGLATCYGIVRQSGGFIEVATRLGNGTTFAIHLPVVDAAATTAGRVADETEDPERGAGTVLVVEDQDNVRELVRRVLTEAGYQVLDAGRPTVAIELVRRHAVDLVLTDVVMPEMNGPALVERLQKIRPLKVLYMSGYTQDALADRFPTQTRILQKPFAPSVLRRAVRAALASPNGSPVP